MKRLILGLSVFVVLSCNEQDKRNESVVVKETPVIAQQVVYKENKKKDSISKNHLELLKSLGMTNSSTYLDNLEIIDVEKTKYYFEKYNLRFISDNSLKKLLKEKDLYVAYLNNFKGRIPEENLNELSTNLSKVQKSIFECKEFFYIRKSFEVSGTRDFLQEINKEEISNFSFIEIGNSLEILSSEENAKYALRIDRKIFYKNKYKQKEIITGHHIPEIKIIATKEDLILSQGEIINEQREVEKNPDPAIIIKVKEGWLVLTSWI